jgi:ADP-ribose pyrophosphatase YjhB (NUDIX family)
MESRKDAGHLDTEQLLTWAKRVQAIAQTGLAYTKDPYDKERYEELRKVAAEILAASARHVPAELIDSFTAETGYATPKIAVRAAVFASGRLLLVKERGDGKWALPGGWADVGDSPSTVVIREVKEESGYNIAVHKLAAVYDHNLQGHPPMAYHVYELFFMGELVGDAREISLEENLEIEEAGFFAENKLPPLSLARVMPKQIAHLFDHSRHPEWPTSFD